MFDTLVIGLGITSHAYTVRPARLWQDARSAMATGGGETHAPVTERRGRERALVDGRPLRVPGLMSEGCPVHGAAYFGETQATAPASTG